MTNKKSIRGDQKNFHKKIGPFTLKRLARKAGIAEDVSMSTISRVLWKHGFRYLHSRRKAIMKPTDFTKPMKFAWVALKYPMDFLTKNINFYLDGTQVQCTWWSSLYKNDGLEKKNLKDWIPYTLPKVKELALVVGWHTLWEPYHLDTRRSMSPIPRSFVW